MQGLDPEEFENMANATQALILDTRHARKFGKAFIPNAINIGLDGSFAVWAGTLIPDIKQPILLVTEPGREQEAVTRLARVGYDHVLGYLRGGIEAWERKGVETDSIPSVSALEFSAATLADPNIEILDVRKQSEYDAEHIIGAINLPLDYINENMIRIDKHKKYYVHCGSGYRSMTFVSILKARGYNNLINVSGGFGAIKSTGKFEITDYVCPTTML
jgi:rhodanese-related sulfurtransferase